MQILKSQLRKTFQSFLLTACVALCIVVAYTGCTVKKTVAGKFISDSSIVYEPDSQYASMRIPALVLSNKGTLLAFCEGRIGTASDYADMDMLLRRSTDKGKTWGPYIVIAAREGQKPTSNATPIVDSDGVIHLLYQRDYERAYYTQSKDDGITWSKAVDITYVFNEFKSEYDWKVLAPGPGHSIQLKNGRLLVPVWLAASDKLLPHKSHKPSCVATIYSDDLGKTWKRGNIVADNSPELKNPNETMAVQLDDGRVMLNMRNPSDVRRRSISYSVDGATNWTKPEFDDELFEPVCMASIIKVPAKTANNKSMLLFTNPDSRNIPKYPRKNLTVKLSYDDGQSWPVQKVINEGPSGYSDMAVDKEGIIYCLYETNTVGKGFNYSLILKKFNINKLTK